MWPLTGGTGSPTIVSRITDLPPSARPYQLANRFARIAHNLASMWDRPAECRAYFDDLLVDKRGGRQGFPKEIVAELLRLRHVYADHCPTTDLNWQIPKL